MAEEGQSEIIGLRNMISSLQDELKTYDDFKEILINVRYYKQKIFNRYSLLAAFTCLTGYLIWLVASKNIFEVRNGEFYIDNTRMGTACSFTEGIVNNLGYVANIAYVLIVVNYLLIVKFLIIR